jgi:FMN phosphatase YigB (HAD superfamily)
MRDEQEQEIVTEGSVLAGEEYGTASDPSYSSFIPHPSSFRVLLWDIDGTLIHSRRRGAFKDYTIPMLEEVFGTAGRLPEMIVSGMTDLQIVGEALKHEGFTNEDIFERVDHLRESYMVAMRKATGNGDQFFELLPGVRETLEAVTAHPRYRSRLSPATLSRRPT